MKPHFFNRDEDININAIGPGLDSLNNPNGLDSLNNPNGLDSLGSPNGLDSLNGLDNIDRKTIGNRDTDRNIGAAWNGNTGKGTEPPRSKHAGWDMELTGNRRADWDISTGNKRAGRDISTGNKRAGQDAELAKVKDADGDADRSYQARYERRQRMRRERQRQIRRRRMLQRVFCLGVLGVLVVFLGFTLTSRKKSDTDENRPQAQEETLKEQADQQGKPEGGEGKTELETSTGGTGNIADATEADETAQGSTGSGQEGAGIADHFQTTPDTVSIRGKKVASTHAILVDERTGSIIASKSAKKKVFPASMTKVLTVLVAAEQVTEEELDDKFKITTEITDYAYVNGCSAAGFVDGEKVTVRDLFYGTILPSGGDAAVGLAQYVAGSHKAFVDQMNDKLEELGISGSAHFTNCVGLYDKDHYCTVYDMAVIMQAALRNKLCRKVLSAHTYTTVPTARHPEGITLSNWFLRRIEDKDTGGEVLSAKTGYIAQSQNCAVSYGLFADKTPYICVTAGAASSWRCIYDHVEIYHKYARAD